MTSEEGANAGRPMPSTIAVSIVNDQTGMNEKRMRLQYAGTCRDSAVA